MNALRALSWVALLPLFLAGAGLQGGCKKEAAPPVADVKPVDGLFTLTGEAMGTTWSAQWGPVPSAEDGRKAIEGALEAVNLSASTYRGDSELSRLNAHQSTDPITITPALHDLLSKALLLAEASDGAFDPTVGPLMSLYGFRGQAKVPTTLSKEDAKARVGWKKLKILPNHQVQKAHPLLQIDLGGLAKGVAVDKAAAALRGLGAKHVLVELGGECVAIGGKPSGDPWQIKIEHPTLEQGTGKSARPPIVLNIKDGALATSGDYRQRVELGGQVRHHIFDPRVGENALSSLRSVSIMAPSAAIADGLATAVMVMGPEAGAVLVDDMGGSLLTQQEGSEGELIVERAGGFPQ